jgi:hypothetical protein
MRVAPCSNCVRGQESLAHESESEGQPPRKEGGKYLEYGLAGLFKPRLEGKESLAESEKRQCDEAQPR